MSLKLNPAGFTTINSSLDAFLHGAQAGDVEQAKRLHEMLEGMLTEREMPDGQMWLTGHGKEVLADMHHQLSECNGCGARLQDVVLDAVRLGPHKGSWRDTSSFFHDLQIATAVANELCEQRGAGLKPSVMQAAKTVSDSGDFDLSSLRIGEIYEEIASTVHGFREI